MTDVVPVTTEPAPQATTAELVQQAEESVRYHEDAIVWCDAIATQVEARIPLAYQARRDAYLALEALPFTTVETFEQYEQLRAARERADHAEGDVVIAEGEALLARAAVDALYPNREEARSRLVVFQAELGALDAGG